jgi:AcrR family transcriptional regulator
MGVHERRERERIETREKILDAARELFIAEGYDGVSMRQVAEKIEYTPTTIYGYFRDKEELFLELCHSDLRDLAESFVKLAQIPGLAQRLRRIGHAYIDFGLKNPNHYRMMFMTAHPEITEEVERRMGKGNPEKDAYAFLRHTVVEALAAGLFRNDLNDPELIAQTLWAGAHGMVSLQIAKGDDKWVPWRSLKRRADLMLDGLLKGLLQEGK